jgi:hypothetical protein
MQYVDERYRLRVDVQARECAVPTDEFTRMQQLLAPIGEAVQGFPGSDLQIRVVHHPRSQEYQVNARLAVPGRTLFSADRDAYLDTAFQRCVRKLARKAEEYASYPERDAVTSAVKRNSLERDLMMPEDRDAGPLGVACRAGDYRAFRVGLAGYEEWIRKRVGRWLQRYPQAEARLGDGLRIGDIVEEVYLNAFECFGQRPVEVPLNQWLNELIDPSVKMVLRHPDRESENASMARTLRDARQR